MSEPFDFIPQSWSHSEAEIWYDAFGQYDQIFDDRIAQALYDYGFFNFDISPDERQAIRENLYDYLMDEYGIDFDQVFDWEAWRAAYGEG